MLLLAASVCPAHAAQTTATLSAQALELGGMLRDAPADDELSIFVGASAGQLLPARLTVWIDGEEATHYQYSQTQARSLMAGTVQALYARQVPGGIHQIRCAVTAIDPLAPPYSPRSQVQLSSTFQKDDGHALALQISFTQGSVLGAPALTLQAQAPESIGGLHLHAADFLLDDRRPFEAYAELLEAGDAGHSRLPRVQQQLQLAADAAAGPDSAVLDQYNRAAALLAEGSAPAAVPMLAALGAQTSTPAPLADHANVALGYALLQLRRNAEAIAAFQRVRSSSSEANLALLGYGWACLLSPNAPIDSSGHAPSSYALPDSQDETARLRRAVPFRHLTAVASGARADDIKRALVPWTELIGRDPADPAVQEGMLAVPYAMSHLGAQVEAQDYALRAIEQLQAAHDVLASAPALLAPRLALLLDQYLADDHDGWHQQFAELVQGRRWWLEGSSGDLSPYLLHLLAEDADIRETLNQYRTLYQLRGFVRQLLQRKADDAQASALMTQVEAALRAQQAQVLELSAQRLAARAHATAQYLAEAHLLVARLHDHGEETALK